ncbi:MAG TPA: SRPBCC domain-containing protein [Flavisolibacter sp.]|jgi:uncharacterized protein YndB with AHSA1/START domain|nr:SRPBCC domain-containing protein [Flavisolibacter sp.]
MQNQNFTITILVDGTPADVFKAITDVARWWTGEPGVEGTAHKIGNEFTYRYNGFHYSKQIVTELSPGEKIVWLITESKLDFTKEPNEWTGTQISFDIFPKNNKTALRFTHAGLTQNKECFTDCSNAWTSYINGSLKNFIHKTIVQRN